jgi:tripartite-type tricarboxylate transporter receptor subunit TctC
MKKLLLALLFLPLVAFAWEPGPNHPITVLVGNAPGAGNEIAFRQLSAIIGETDKNPNFIIVNQPGADSVVSMNNLFKAAPDGYTINALSHMSTFVTNDIWEKDIKKFQWNSFNYALTIGKSPLVLVAAQHSNVNTPVDFIRVVSSTTKPINVAIGGGAHRTAFEFLMDKGHGNKNLVKVIKYQGPLQAVTSVAQFDVTGSGTEFGIMPIAVAKPLIEAGKVKPIGFTGTRKMPQFPNVPLLNTVAPGINVYAAWSIALPPNTPPDIVAWYTTKFAAALKSQEYQQWCYDNVVFTDDSELTPDGVLKHAQSLRDAFLPVLNKIDLSKE